MFKRVFLGLVADYGERAFKERLPQRERNGRIPAVLPHRGTRMAAAKLAKYQSMRDFEATPEPSGRAPVAKSDRLRFVIQKHAATRLHYDLRLEWQGVFLSWAVTRGPSLDPADKRLAVEVEPHPLDYGDFEGTIPKGQYGGGTVLLWDRGFWGPEEDGGDVEAQLKKGDLKVRFDGQRMQGGWVLVRIKNDRSGGKRTNWLLIKHRDGGERPGDADALLAEDASIASGRTMQEITLGVGKGPTPFMTKPAKKASAKAVWNSNRDDKAQSKPAPTPRPAKPKKVEVPTFVAPQLAKLVDRPPTEAGWAHEIKFDGYRTQLHVDAGKVRLLSRSGLDWTHRFPELAADAADWPDCVADGEVTALNGSGMPDFPGLTTALSSGKTSGLVFYLFDLLFEAGLDLRPLPLTERKQRLAELMDGLEPAGGRLRYVDHFETGGEAVLLSACRMELEGIVSKRLDAAYQSGRGETWLKSKCRGGQEVVIAGWTQTGDKFRSLIAGVQRDGALIHVGRIGTGYTAATAAELMKRLRPLSTKTSPFAETPKASWRTAGSTMHWVRPELVAEIEFAGWTADGHLRQASFKGVREDKPAADVSLETPAPADDRLAATIAPDAAHKAVEDAEADAQTDNQVSPAGGRVVAKRPGGRVSSITEPPGVTTRSLASPRGSEVVRGVTISNAGKPLWPATADTPAFTKHDLAAYLEAVGDRMLPHFKGRPVSIVRTPDGIEGDQRFFQRHAGKGQSALIDQVSIKDDKQPYIVANTVEALIALAQTGATEMHPWNGRPDDLETPGRFVFDLDPAPDVPFDAVIEAARDVADLLREIGLEPFCKTTGGKGLHVVTPLAKERDPVAWPEAKAFTRAVCQRLVDEHPDRYLLSMSKAARTGKIFLDYLRNDRTATAVGPYSPRARPRATVSMPLKWTQVRKGLDPQAFTIASVPALLKKPDPWADYDEGAKPLKPAMKALIASGRG